MNISNPSPNFAYLAHHDARLVALATQAEEHFAADPTVTLFKLRQFGEVHHRLDGRDLKLGFSVRLEISELLHVEDVGEGLEVLEAQILECVGRLFSQRVAVDEEEHSAESLHLARVSSLTVAMNTIGNQSTALDRSILAKAFRGTLVAQDPSDLPAEVMLARMLAPNGVEVNGAPRQPGKRDMSAKTRTRA